MSEEQKETSVYESHRFEFAIQKLSEAELSLVENEIDKVIADPRIGSQKKNNMSHVWVYEFKLGSKQFLLGYGWKDNNRLEFYLLGNFNPKIEEHENVWGEHN